MQDKSIHSLAKTKVLVSVPSYKKRNGGWQLRPGIEDAASMPLNRAPPPGRVLVLLRDQARDPKNTDTRQDGKRTTDDVTMQKRSAESLHAAQLISRDRDSPAYGKSHNYPTEQIYHFNHMLNEKGTYYPSVPIPITKNMCLYESGLSPKSSEILRAL